MSPANPDRQETPPDDLKVIRRRFRRSEAVLFDYPWFIEGPPHGDNQMS
jgi:hypothetical protein